MIHKTHFLIFSNYCDFFDIFSGVISDPIVGIFGRSFGVFVTRFQLIGKFGCFWWFEIVWILFHRLMKSKIINEFSLDASNCTLHFQSLNKQSSINSNQYVMFIGIHRYPKNPHYYVFLTISIQSNNNNWYRKNALEKRSITRLWHPTEIKGNHLYLPQTSWVLVLKISSRLSHCWIFISSIYLDCMGK